MHDGQTDSTSFYFSGSTHPNRIALELIRPLKNAVPVYHSRSDRVKNNERAFERLEERMDSSLARVSYGFPPQQKWTRVLSTKAKLEPVR